MKAGFVIEYEFTNMEEVKKVTSIEMAGVHREVRRQIGEMINNNCWCGEVLVVLESGFALYAWFESKIGR